MSLNDVRIFLKDGPFESDIGIDNLHPTKGTHWVVYNNGNYFYSYGCAPLLKLSEIFTKRNGQCLVSENKIQGLTGIKDCYCTRYCLYKLCSTKVIGLVFKSAVLNIYYQMIKER